MAMASKRIETSSSDCINSLPDEVLGQILSLVPTKLAASTSVLSKRWRNLLPLVDNLDFDGSMVLYPERSSSRTGGRGGRFVDFVEKTLGLLRDSPIKKFALKLESEMEETKYNHIVYNALERGVSELYLSSVGFQSMESEFFFSKTLVKLTLSDSCLYHTTIPPNGVLFPALKTLSLIRVSFGWVEATELYECLLACPLLEEFNMCSDEPFKSCWRKHVWGSSIQRISIFYRYDDLEAHSSVAIETPNLVYLDYSSYVCEDYDVELDSLVEARLDLVLWKYNDSIQPVFPFFGYDSTKGDDWGDATKLVAAIRSVVTLHLSADSLEVLYFCCKDMPEFNNLVNLSFESHKERGWQVLPLLLKKSPNLETLVIKGLVHEITDQCGDVCVCVHENKKKKKKKKKKKSCLLSCRVKVLMVYGYEGSCRELKQMKHFVKRLRCLEVVKVKVQVDQQDKYLPLTNDLMKLLPNTSSKCKIEFI